MDVLDLLLRASLEGAVLVAAIWILVRAIPLSASLRTALWWCAAARFVVSLVWVAPISVPLLPPPATAAPALAASAVPEAAGGGLAVGAGAPATGLAPRRVAWPTPSGALAFAWCFGAAAMLVAMARRWRQTARVIRRAAPAPPHVQEAAVRLARRLALARPPGVRISADVQTPLVAGLARPLVLLPARFAQLPPLQQRMVLCHELAHVRRGDLWFGCVPALAERLFFFHPLARLAAREYVFWRESACDAAVLRMLDVSPREYGRLLLDLGIAPPRASLAAAGASWSFSNLKRRIHMLGDPTTASPSTRSRFLAAAVVALAAGAVIPLRLVARTPVAPAALEPAAAIAEPLQAAVQQPQPPAPPVTPAPPAPAAPVTSRHEREPRYVLFTGEGDERSMSGSQRDVERAKSLRKGNEPLLWFTDARGEFVVRDPSIVREVEQIWAPVGELGAKQGQFGARQGSLGARMGELGAKQGQLGAEQGRIGARHGRIASRHAELAAQERDVPDARRAELEKARQALDAEVRALDDEMKALSEKMREHEKPMRELSAEMEALGREMGKLGEKLEQAAERAQADMRRLLDKAVASGKAERVK